MVDLKKSTREVILALVAGLLFIYAAGLFCANRNLKYTFNRMPRTITEKVKDIQVIVGCEKIDGWIGPETTDLANARARLEEQEQFNIYASRYMTPTGAPDDSVIRWDITGARK